jgi:hypothetical protein
MQFLRKYIIKELNTRMKNIYHRSNAFDFLFLCSFWQFIHNVVFQADTLPEKYLLSMQLLPMWGRKN